MTRVCSVPGCIRPTIHHTGMCCTHATMRRHGKPLRELGTGRPKRRARIRTCSVDGCPERAAPGTGAGDLCRRHYQLRYDAELARLEAGAGDEA